VAAACFLAPAIAGPRPDDKASRQLRRKSRAAEAAGHFNLYWDAKQGKRWLEIAKWGSEFLYTSLPAGVGSNDIGLDRGQLGDTRIVRFERTRPKVLLVQSNLDARLPRRQNLRMARQSQTTTIGRYVERQ